MKKLIVGLMTLCGVGILSGCGIGDGDFSRVRGIYSYAHDIEGNYGPRTLTFSVTVPPITDPSSLPVVKIPRNGGTLLLKLVPYSQVKGTSWERYPGLRRTDVSPEMWKQAVVILEQPREGTPGYDGAQPGVYLTSRQAPIIKNITNDTIELELTGEQIQMFLKPNSSRSIDFWVFVNVPGDNWAEDFAVSASG